MAVVTALEMPATWGDPAGALLAVERELERIPRSDLVLLPEAALTGYVSPSGDFDLSRFAEPLDGPTCGRLAALAARHRLHLAGPLVLAGASGPENAVALFDPGGTLLFCYGKRHPWFPERWATAGAAPAPVVRAGDLTVTIAICFDIHFVAEEQAEALAASDLLLFPSAWVEDDEGHDSREEILGGLARRFGMAIANANWGPGVVEVPGQGRSRIYGAGGRVLAEAERERPWASSMLEDHPVK